MRGEWLVATGNGKLVGTVQAATMSSHMALKGSSLQLTSPQHTHTHTHTSEERIFSGSQKWQKRKEGKLSPNHSWALTRRYKVVTALDAAKVYTAAGIILHSYQMISRLSLLVTSSPLWLHHHYCHKGTTQPFPLTDCCLTCYHLKHTIMMMMDFYMQEVAHKVHRT